jgi:hypothetical protein
LDGGKHHRETVFDHCLFALDNINKKCHILKISALLHDVGKKVAANLNEEGNITFHHHEFHSVKLARRDLRALKFSNFEIESICNLIDIHMFPTDNPSPRTARKLFTKLREKNITLHDFFRIRVADHNGNKKQKPFTFADIKRRIRDLEVVLFEPEAAFSIKDLAINGNDVMEVLNIKPSKIVGDTLKRLFDLVLENPELNNRETLLKLI